MGELELTRERERCNTVIGESIVKDGDGLGEKKKPRKKLIALNRIVSQQMVGRREPRVWLAKIGSRTKKCKCQLKKLFSRAFCVSVAGTWQPCRAPQSPAP